MRIITGEFKGRRLLTPKSYDVRPTTDKVKEAIFDMLYQYIKADFVCLDLFAGTGNLGLEAISRGAKTCYFSDSSRESIKLIKENIKICGAEEYSVILSGDYRQNLERIHDKVDIILIDPPYASDFYLDALSEISKADILNKDGCIVCEHSDRDELPDEFAGFTKVKDKRYGSIGVTIYE